jgi:hypothetical protein
MILPDGSYIAALLDRLENIAAAVPLLVIELIVKVVPALQLTLILPGVPAAWFPPPSYKGTRGFQSQSSIGGAVNGASCRN